MRNSFFKIFYSIVICICFVAFITSSHLYSKERKTSQIQVIHSCDANIDSIMATTILLADPKISLQGVIVTNADCFPEYALSTYEKIQEFLNYDFPCGLSSSRVWNQFPWIWKRESITLDQTPCLAHCTAKEKQLLFKGDNILMKILKKAKDNSIVIMATGPLSTIADAFKKNNALEKKIKAMYWMGGAIDTPGNLHESTIPKLAQNPYAEWNVYSDAYAVDWIFQNTSFPIYLIPLDLTNSLKITPEFFEKLRIQSMLNLPFSRLAFEAYDIIYNQSKVEYLWDVVATVNLTKPEYFEKPILCKLRVITNAKNHGALVRCDHGRNVFVTFRFSEEGEKKLLQYLTKLFMK